MFRKLLALTLCLLMLMPCALAAPAAEAPAAEAAADMVEQPSLFNRVNTFSGFSDTGTHWALPYIKLCYETDLMKGQGGGRFAPDAQITNAEVAAIAARIHAAVNGTHLSVQGTPWYQCYLDHLSGAGITVKAPKANATRQGFFELLSAVVPDHMLLPINSITALPDTSDPSVLKFYNAGILTGVDLFGTFDGAKPLTRGECAAMAARVVDPFLRRYFTPAGQIPAAPFPDDAVVFTVNGNSVPFLDFSNTMLSLIDETQTLYADYGLVFRWDENYGHTDWDWPHFFKAATLHSLAAESLATRKAMELGCPPEELALTLFGPPTQAELDAYAAEHDISAISPDATDALTELLLEEKLNTQLDKWVDEATVVTTETYDALDPQSLWEVYGAGGI